MRNIEKDTLICTKCKIEKEWTEFSYDKTTNRVQSHCKKCKNEYFRLHYKNDQEKNWLLREYGITIEKRDNIKKEQNNKCPICGINFDILSSKDIHVDHCHKTNKVRGILCRSCNSMLGFAKDNKNLLFNGAMYLQKFRK